VADDGILDVLGDRAVVLGPVVMRVAIDDEEILVLALPRLTGRLAEQGPRVELLDGGIAQT